MCVIGKFSGQFFIFKQDTARQTGHMRQSTFLHVILPNIHRFKKN